MVQRIADGSIRLAGATASNHQCKRAFLAQDIIQIQIALIGIQFHFRITTMISKSRQSHTKRNTIILMIIIFDPAN